MRSISAIRRAAVARVAGDQRARRLRAGTLAGVITRRYHGLLIAGLPAPLGRLVMVSQLGERLRLPGGAVHWLSGEERKAVRSTSRARTGCASSGSKPGLPVWVFEIDGYTLEKRLLLPRFQNTVLITYSLVDGVGAGAAGLAAAAQRAAARSAQWTSRCRTRRALVAREAPDRSASAPEIPSLRLKLGRAGAFTVDALTVQHLRYRLEESRGYQAAATRGVRATFASISPRRVGLVDRLDRDARDDDGAVARRSAAPSSNDGGACSLSADPGAGRSRDGGARARGRSVRDHAGGARRGCGAGARGRRRGADRDRRLPLVHRLGPRHDDQPRGADAHHRPRRRSARHPAHVRVLLPRRADSQPLPRGQQAKASTTPPTPRCGSSTRSIATSTSATTGRRCSCCCPSSTTRPAAPRRHALQHRHRSRGRPAPAGDRRLALTWMDAKMDDWVVTPRRGKAGRDQRALVQRAAPAGRLARARRRCRRAASSKRWRPRVRDIVQPSFLVRGRRLPLRHRGRRARRRSGVPSESDPVVLAPTSGPRPVALGAVLARSKRDSSRLRPAVARSGHPDYKAQYYGDLRARDGAYHQGTVWAWLIGPFIDAWLAPSRPRRRATFCHGFLPHLDEACVGSISEIFDAEEPYTPRGCVAQAWSVAEVLRCWVKTGGDARSRRGAHRNLAAHGTSMPGTRRRRVTPRRSPAHDAPAWRPAGLARARDAGGGDCLDRHPRGDLPRAARLLHPPQPGRGIDGGAEVLLRLHVRCCFSHWVARRLLRSRSSASCMTIGAATS